MAHLRPKRPPSLECFKRRACEPLGLLIAIVQVLSRLVFCLLSIPFMCQPPLHSALVKLAEKHVIVFFCVAQQRPQQSKTYCIQSSLQWGQEIPEVIHAAYCFLFCSQSRFHRLAPSLSFPLHTPACFSSKLLNIRESSCEKVCH